MTLLKMITLAWTVFLMLFAVVVFFRKDQKQVGDYEKIAPPLTFFSWEMLFLFFILTVGLALRIWRFGQVPGGVNQDEAMAIVDAKALADYGTDRFGMLRPVHFTAWTYSQMSVLLSYTMVPFIKLFGYHIISVRLPQLLISLISLPVTYFLFRKIFGIRSAQIVLLMLITNPWHMIQSRWAIDCNLFPHMFLLGLFFLIYGFLKQKERDICVAMLFFALCMYSYGIAFYTVPVFLLVVGFYAMQKKVIKGRTLLLGAGIYLLFSWPIYLTMGINTLHLKTMKTPWFTMPSFPDSIRSNDILFFSNHKWQQLLHNSRSMLQVFIRGDELPWNTLSGFGVLFSCFQIFVLLGCLVTFFCWIKEKDQKKKVVLFCLLSFLGMGVLAGVITANVNVNRINIIIYAWIFFSAIGVGFVMQNAKKLAWTILPFYFIFSFLFVKSYFTSYVEQINQSFYKDFLTAVGRIQESKCEKYCITPDSQCAGATAVSEILTLFEHQVDAKYFQGILKDENGLTYSEKYSYHNPEKEEISSQTSVAYVVTDKQIDFFEKEEFQIQKYGKYYAVFPKEDVSYGALAE